MTLSEVINDPGQLVVGEQVFKNAGEAANGSVSLVRALEVSSDVFFYTLGLRMSGGDQLQHWGHALGIGRPTGIDLPLEDQTLLPSKKWRDRLYREGGTEEPWTVGDNIQLATGQGDLQTNPLQMAIAYATLANGGTVVSPHVGMEITDAAGRVLKEFGPKPRRRVRIDPEYRAAILEGLHDAAQNGAGTSCDDLLQLPDPGRGQDRYGPAAAARGSVLVRHPRSLPEPAHRHLRYDGGRRLRQRIGRAGRKEDPGSVFRQSTRS